MIDLIPPHAIEAERSLLGCSLFTGRETEVKGEFFYQDSHRIINDTINSLVGTGKAIDLVTVCDELTQGNKLEAVGGASYIASLFDIGVDSPNIEAYRRIIQSKSNLRRILQFCTDTIAEVTSNGHNPDQFCLEWQIKAQSLVDVERGKQEPLVDTIKRVMKEIEYRSENKSDLIGIPSGFIDVDKLTRGFRPSNLYVLAGRPSMGKTSFALCAARHAGREGNPIMIVSIEMSREELIIRLLGIESKVDTERIQTGTMNREEYVKVLKAASKINELPIIIIDNEKITDAEIHHLARKHKPSMVFIDHLGLVDSATRHENETLKIGALTKSGKAMAKRLKIPVIYLCQLNRQVEQRTDKRPLLSDLRQSGEIEQDADGVIFLYRDEYYNPENTKEKGIAEARIAKHRNGRIGTVKLAWIQHSASFESLAWCGNEESRRYAD